MMKHYMSTIQASDSMPGDFIPPPGRGWELFSFAERSGGSWLIAWVREEKPCHCLACPSGMTCSAGHTPYPHCAGCAGTGWVPA